MDANARRNYNETHGFSSILQGVPIGIPLDFNGFVSILQAVPRRTSIDFCGFAYILQGVPLRISFDFHPFCKGYPLGFHLIL
jgi:hypothetical protein